MRDDFRAHVKQLLAKRVSYRCSRCRAQTSGPTLRVEGSINVGVAAHISAAAEGGARFNPALSAAARSHISNGIWLCQNCAKLVDSDAEQFTVELLQQWKHQAEREALEKVGKAASASAQPLDASPVRETAEAESAFLGLLELMYILVLLDQFSNGVWGASLQETASLFGHKAGDPGSISVSTLSCLAITKYTGSSTAKPIRAYRAYLQERQSHNGAFGMKREIGTARYPQSNVLEHSRHTATALEFFLRYDGVKHPRIPGALAFLLRERTEQGLWTDTQPREHANVDPVTVAYVINVLELIREHFTDGGLASGITPALLDEHIQTGLRYLFIQCRLRTSDGFWHYKYGSAEERARVLQNCYQYAADVANKCATSCVRLSLFKRELIQIIEQLLDIGSAYGGIPDSADSNVVSLYTTVMTIRAAQTLGAQSETTAELLKSLPVVATDENVVESATAAGWAAVLGSSDMWTGLSAPSIERLRQLEGVVSDAHTHNALTHDLASLMGTHAALAQALLGKRALISPA